jgi:CheY-like chemotaxis protein/HPt (histidine-containing phosphotransfer) domain-containing protein
LLAEDNEVNQQVAVGMIERLGYRVDIVPTGAEAVAALQQAAYHVVLMDCQMSEMDGFEATREIRRREQQGSRIPIVALTANAMQGDRERCLAAGMDDYISKPIKPEMLEQVLERWVSATPEKGPGLLEARERKSGPHPAPALSRAARNSAPFDMSQLHSIVGQDPTALRKFLDLFETTTGSLVARVTEAVRSRDAGALKRLAHTLKGSCGSVGADEMAGISTSLEAAATEEGWSLVDDLHGKLEASFDRTKSFTSGLRG